MRASHDATIDYLQSKLSKLADQLQQLQGERDTASSSHNKLTQELQLKVSKLEKVRVNQRMDDMLVPIGKPASLSGDERASRTICPGNRGCTVTTR